MGPCPATCLFPLLPPIFLPSSIPNVLCNGSAHRSCSLFPTGVTSRSALKWRRPPLSLLPTVRRPNCNTLFSPFPTCCPTAHVSSFGVCTPKKLSVSGLSERSTSPTAPSFLLPFPRTPRLFSHVRRGARCKGTIVEDSTARTFVGSKEDRNIVPLSFSFGLADES